MKILIFGSSGFIGKKIKRTLSKNHAVFGAGIDAKEEFKIDASNGKEVEDLLLKEKPEVVIDLIGIPNIKFCEENPEKANSINYLTAKNIAQTCRKIDCKIIFISSSCVFDGKKGNYKEEDSPTGNSVYAKTKILAEKEILKLKKGIVIRIEMAYGYNGPKEVNGVIEDILSDKELLIRNPSQIRQPLILEDLSKAIEILIAKDKSGIYNVAGEEKIKKREFMIAMSKIAKDNKKIKIQEENRTTENLTLDISKIKNLGFKPTSLKDGISLIKKQISNQEL